MPLSRSRSACVWGGADVLRGIVEVVKWPFERAVWAIERCLVWPLGGAHRGTGTGQLRALWRWCPRPAGSAALAYSACSGPPAAVAAEPPAAPEANVPAAAPIVRQATPHGGGGSAGAARSNARLHRRAGRAAPRRARAPVRKAPPRTVARPPQVVRPRKWRSRPARVPATRQPAQSLSNPLDQPAVTVAREFAGAFVLYEIGRNDLAGGNDLRRNRHPASWPTALLQRPPRLPASVKVPKAKVLNVVAGPHTGDTYTLSVSLLRVGVTSELRLEMQRKPKDRRWQVTDVARLMRSAAQASARPSRRSAAGADRRRGRRRAPPATTAPAPAATTIAPTLEHERQRSAPPNRHHAGSADAEPAAPRSKPPA